MAVKARGTAQPQALAKCSFPPLWKRRRTPPGAPGASRRQETQENALTGEKGGAVKGPAGGAGARAAESCPPLTVLGAPDERVGELLQLLPVHRELGGLRGCPHASRRARRFHSNGRQPIGSRGSGKGKPGGRRPPSLLHARAQSTHVCPAVLLPPPAMERSLCARGCWAGVLFGSPHVPVGPLLRPRVSFLILA